MEDSSNIVQNVDKVCVSFNEPKNLIYSLNRGIKQLVENDVAVYGEYEKILSGMVIQPFDERKLSSDGYQDDDLVWFMGDDGRLRILRCIWPDNRTYPEQENGIYDGSGWNDQFEYLDVRDFGIDQIISSAVQIKLIQDHETVPEYHRFGSLSMDPESEDYLDRKLLKRDISNLDNTRETMHFPVITRFMSPDDSVIKGFYRRYDTGIVEYDILFRVGYVDVKFPNRFGNMDVLSCNSFKLNQMSDQADQDSAAAYDQNKKYFHGNSEDIFLQDPDSQMYSIVGNVVQMNRSDLVNAYVATISFPVPFLDLNYTIFSSDVMSQTYDGKDLVPGANSMTFCDKTKNSVKAVYITFPDRNNKDYNVRGSNARRGGLCANSFHMKVIGNCIRS